MDPVDVTRRLTRRAAREAAYARTVLQARGVGVALIPPHRLLASLRDLTDYGPIGGVLALAVAGFRDHPAIIDEQGTLTFGELDARSSALANALRDRGFNTHDGGARDGLGILARNHRGMYEAIFAGAKLGARTLLLNTDFAGPQLADVCAREGVSALIHDAEFTPAAASVDAVHGKYVSWYDAPGSDPSVDGLIDTADGRRPARPATKQRIVLLTSGTTGTPKGAPRDVTLSLALPGGYLSKIPLRAGRTVVLAAPAFHAWGLLSSTLALGLGNTLVLTRRADPAATLAALEHHRADALISVPILLARLLDLGAQEISRHDLSALRVIGVSGSALSGELASRVMDQFGDVVYNLYGSTEVSYATIATPADLRAAPGTVGRPPAGTTLRLLDPDGRDVAPGESGRIFVGSTTQFEGYTGGGSKATVDGFMSTGDVGHLDAAGRLFVDGRDDDMIVSGGENVFPAEVEELLGAHPGVREAAVTGVDDAQFGTRLRAYVVRAGGAAVTEDDLREHVKANLARYKVPRDVIFLDTLPRNPAGKVVKRDLPR